MTSQKRELYLESGNCSSQTFPKKDWSDVPVACRLLDLVVSNNNRLAALNHSSTPTYAVKTYLFDSRVFKDRLCLIFFQLNVAVNSHTCTSWGQAYR